MTSVLFICYDNYLRSVLAETLAARRWGAAVRVMSAGVSTHAARHKECHPRLAILFGLTETPRARHLDDVDWRSFTRIVAMDDTIAARLLMRKIPLFRIIRWNVADPQEDTPEAWRLLMHLIETRLVESERELLQPTEP
jgi:protein-tyrosine-phosphatase